MERKKSTLHSHNLVPPLAENDALTIVLSPSHHGDKETDRDSILPSAGRDTSVVRTSDEGASEIEAHSFKNETRHPNDKAHDGGMLATSNTLLDGEALHPA